ncbi:MAG: U32 family peptidase [Clostridia bacterium]|jgi:putative protease|nr:U32 family peptidase [Clostridia bacterium]MDD4146181.1 U32 family peptidase [Clostridia bacterium]MDD4665558.1 U32 family peptidase [Clostridia bacterium]
MRQKVELLAPAGNLEKLKMAIIYGADAVYLGGKEYGLRASAGNFTLQEIKEGVKFAHQRKAKVYVTVNIFAHNQDLDNLPGYLRELESIGVDGLIFSDPGVWQIAQEINSKLSLHLSTQANTTNWASAQFWQEHGVERLVLARELALDEIKEIREKVDAELEIFVHGAMCISYSGRCLLSNYMAAGRDANLGECAQPCRWNYALVEEKRPGQVYPIFEDERGSYIFNSQDLCLIRHLPELINAGVDSLKIEGRMKSVHYVATVVYAYRKALDAYYADPESYVFAEKWYEEILKISHRDYTTGFLFGKPQAEAQNYETSAYLRYYDFVGLVLAYDEDTGMATVEQRNNFKVGDVIEIMGPQTELFTQRVEVMQDKEGREITVAPHPRQIVCIKVDKPVRPWDLIRRAKNIGGKD